MHLTHIRRGWRKVAVVGGSLVALALGGAASMTQALADPGTVSAPHLAGS